MLECELYEFGQARSIDDVEAKMIGLHDGQWFKLLDENARSSQEIRFMTFNVNLHKRTRRNPE